MPVPTGRGLGTGVNHVALNLEQKKAIVAEVAAVAANAHSAVAAENRGLTAGELIELRAKSRSSGVYLRVIKNTLARRAVEGTNFECMREGLVGPLLLAFSQEDPGAAGRLLKDFVRSHEKLVVRLVSVGGQVLTPMDLDRLASLPTREQAIAQLMGLLKAPIEKLVRTLAEPQAKLVRTIAALRDQKQAAA
jgi:large subunit ribosomal protein L10